MLDREFSGIVIEILILLSGDTKKKKKIGKENRPRDPIPRHRHLNKL